MLKKFLCGAALLAAVGFGGPTPAQAKELYVRNQPFVEAYFLGSSTYVPVDTFLKAVDVPWTVQGQTVVLGRGSSPTIRVDRERVTFNADGRQANLIGIIKDSQLFVPAGELARLVGYGVVRNNHTGVVDIVKAHLTTELEREVAAQVKAEAEEEAQSRREKWQERVAKIRAEREAKAAAEAEAAGEDDEDEDEFFDDDEEDPDDEGAKKPKKVAKKEPKVEAPPKPEAPKAEEEKPEPPPKADLVVLSSEANPNTYTGEVVFRAVIQNQGFAGATDVRAAFSVTGPDGKNWVKKTLYHGPIAPDGRWEIIENYKHRLGGQAVTNQDGRTFQVDVKPMFNSAPPPKK